MNETRLAFCDCSVMERWAVQQVASKTKRHCRAELQKAVSRDVQILRDLQAEGIKLACTVTAAAHIVTKFYKGDPPFTGETKAFNLRKAYAREAAASLLSSVTMISPVQQHFEQAELLWWELCDKEVRESFGQFEDYIEAAWILKPPEKTIVQHVLVSHQHLKYLLNKKRASAVIYVFGPWNWR
jgi:hypothetical protein